MERYLNRLISVAVVGLIFYFVRVQIIENMGERQLDRIAQIQHEVQEKLKQQQLAKKGSPELNSEKARTEYERQLKEAKAEAEFDSAFYAWYKEPEGCDNWQSDRHMVKCVQHKISAKSEFRKIYK